MRALPAYNGKVEYTVTVPGRDDDVVYDVTLGSVTTPADTLSPCAYMIGWALPTPTGEANGWTSYFGGNLYSFRNDRLREYHTSWDEAPFRTVTNNGRAIPGVQKQAQFATLLPAFIADELAAISADSLYTVSPVREITCDGRNALRIDAVMDIAGERVKEITYRIDAETLVPLRIDTENNPSSITGQSISAVYSQISDNRNATPLSEEELIALYPETFEKFRESNFRIENLTGTLLPTFSLPTATGERYTHHRGETFKAPTVIAILDPSASFSAETVKAIRDGIESSPVPADVIWAVVTRNIDSAESLVSSLNSGEHLLLNARSLARDCGAASLPVTIVADRAGNVKKVALGFNPELSTIVLQSIALTEN